MKLKCPAENANFQRGIFILSYCVVRKAGDSVNRDLPNKMAAEGSDRFILGVRSEITTDIPAMVAELKKTARVPVAVGFGISTPEQAVEIAADADGVIVGSAIVKIIERYGAKASAELFRYVKQMKDALK